jgi:hypothetical protein
MENNIGTYIASGGVSGAVVCVFYFLYKCLYKKRIRSTCMGGTLDIKRDAPSPSSSEKGVQVDIP